MKSGNTYPQNRWTAKPAQREKFFELVQQPIERESKHHASRNGVLQRADDVAQEVRTTLLVRMQEDPPVRPFCADTPEACATEAVEKYIIRDLARGKARALAGRGRGQAQVLEEVDEPTMPGDTEQQLMEFYEDVFRRALPQLQAAFQLTAGDAASFAKEACRQTGAAELDSAHLAEVAQMAGLKPDDLREHFQFHDEHGALSPKDRKAWSRATTAKKLGSAAAKMALLSFFLPLLVLVMVALFSSSAAALAHQPELSTALALEHQSASAMDHQLASAADHQMAPAVACDHQRQEASRFA